MSAALPCPALYIPLGCPGSGKGTFSQLIREYGYVHLSTGDLVREELSRGTAFGLQYAHAISNHIMGGIPFSEILALVQRRTEEALSEQKGVILDGFPKNREQCEILDTFAKERGLDAVPVWIQVDEAAAIDRILMREICEKCKQIYNSKFSPPRTAGRCDTCDIPLTIRSGDNRAKAEERVSDFQLAMEPVLQYYKEKGHLYLLDGNGTLEECAQRFRDFHAKLF